MSEYFSFFCIFRSQVISQAIPIVTIQPIDVYEFFIIIILARGSFRNLTLKFIDQQRITFKEYNRLLNEWIESSLLASGYLCFYKKRNEITDHFFLIHICIIDVCMPVVGDMFNFLERIEATIPGKDLQRRRGGRIISFYKSKETTK